MAKLDDSVSFTVSLIILWSCNLVATVVFPHKVDINVTVYTLMKNIIGNELDI